MKKLLLPILALCALLTGTVQSYSQALVTVDPNADWIGYMNVFQLPGNGGNYLFGFVDPVGNLRGGFTSTNLPRPGRVKVFLAFLYASSAIESRISAACFLLSEFFSAIAAATCDLDNAFAIVCFLVVVIFIKVV